MPPIVLLQPPYFRLLGSHNDRAPLELCYASRFLADAGVEHVVVNADFAGSSQHLPWRALFENEGYFRAAVDGCHPALDECLELVMQYDPETVVIAAGDSCIPTKDVGSPYISAQISKRLRRLHVKTIGIGPIFQKDHTPFDDCFDGFFLSLANRSLVDVLLGDTPDVISGTPVGDLPLFDYVKPHPHSTDYVMSNFGCSFGCSFCFAPLMVGGRVVFQPTGLFLRDVFERAQIIGSSKLYIADMIFPLNVRRLRNISESLNGSGFTFSAESRTDTLREEVVGLLKKIGVTTVKIGLESMDDATLARMNKRQTLQKEEAALQMLKDNNFRVVGYLILGDFYSSVEAMWQTLARARDLQARGLVHDWVVNVAAHSTLGWDERRFDAHFSLHSARRQGVPDDVMWAFLDLQEQRKHPTLGIIHG